MVVPLLSIFFFFLGFLFPHCFCYFCSTFSCSIPASFLPVLTLFGGWHGFVGFALFLPLLRPMGLPAVNFGPLGPTEMIPYHTGQYGRYLSFRCLDWYKNAAVLYRFIYRSYWGRFGRTGVNTGFWPENENWLEKKIF